VKRTSCVNLWVSLAILAMLVIAPPLRAETDTANWLHTGRHVFQSTWNNFIGSWQINGSNVLATATEINTACDAQQFSGTGVNSVATEEVGAVKQTTVTVALQTLQIEDAGLYTNSLLYTFPPGRILVLGTTVRMVATNTINFNNTTADTYQWSLGGATVNSDATADAGEVTFLAAQTLDTASATVVAFTNSSAIASSFQIDGTTTPAPLWVHLFVADANDKAGKTNHFGFAGTVKVTWVNLGDY